MMIDLKIFENLPKHADIGGYWVNKEFFLPLEEYRNKQLEKLLK